MLRVNHYLVSAALALSIVGCASSPKPVPSIEDARLAIQQAESSPLAGQAAAKELADAHTSLREAEALASKHRPDDEVANAAYLAKRHAQIAQQQIMAAASKQSAETAALDRQKVLTEARERDASLKAAEANRANQEASVAKQDANAAREDADQANQRVLLLQKELQDLNAKKTERGYVLTLGDVMFDTAQATLKPGAIPAVDRLAKFLNDDAKHSVVIEGHTDNVGSEEYNQELSQRRANAVQQALVSRGVPSDRIQAIGKGKAFPIASNDSPGGRQQNRRVEIVIDNNDQTAGS